MKKKITSYKLLLILFGLILPYTMYSYEECDSVRSCTGNALYQSVTSGKGAHYVDVNLTNADLETLDGFTVEMWINPERQAGKREFIAGIWGPLKDNNDVWVLYISEDDELVFEINGSQYLEELDNTIVRVPATGLVNKWSHIAAVFDGPVQTAYLYVDGNLQGSSRNAQYPVSSMKKPKDPTLPLQIGSCNALLDDRQTFRTFKGWIDEVRIWNYPVPGEDIYCWKDMSFNGNEEGLVLYFRLNEGPGIYNLCDASGNGHIGRARSGARCREGSGRTTIKKVFVEPSAAINDIMKCDTTVTYHFTIRDTSSCGSTYGIRILDDNVSRYTITPDRVDLEPGMTYDFDVKIDRTLVGPFNARIYAYPYNRCGRSTVIPLAIDRWTELYTSHLSLDMGILYAHCEEVPYTDSIITIKNRSGQVTTSRDLTISDIRTNNPESFEVILPMGVTLPYTMADGDSINITLRFNSYYTDMDHVDTLFVESDDQCYGSGIVPITAETQVVLGLFETDGETPIDTLEFDKTCQGFASDVFNYLWFDLIDEDIYIDTIIVPPNFTSQAFKFDVLLEPATGYMPNYLRFTPEASGVFFDSIIFVVKAGVCNIKHPVYVRGEGFYADLRFEEDSIDFGQVIVGQSKFMYATVENFSTDVLRSSFYVGRGEVFEAVGSIQTLNPGESGAIPITFQPTSDTMYYDRVCFNELDCYNFGCIPIKGEGIYERFRFNPEIMRTESVLACSFELDTVWVVNLSNEDQTLEFFSLNTVGYYSWEDPPAAPDQMIIKAKDSARFIFRFTPNDLTQDIAEQASLRFKTMPDLTQWDVPMYGTSSLPKIFVTDLTKFGLIEVGDTKRKTITIENINKKDIIIDSIITSEGFVLISPSNYPNITLKPREAIQAEIEFAPDTEGEYSGTVTVYSSNLCEVSQEGVLEGKAIIVPLDVAVSVISFGFVKPCECMSRELLLINRSKINDMVIDSIWIDDENITGSPRPELFTWTSYYSPSGEPGYDIPFQKVDTVKIKFCPNTPATEEYLTNEARIHVKAHGPGWEREYDTYLIGKRTFNIYPDPQVVTFPPTQVDTFSIPPEMVYIYIPDIDYNPYLEDVKIDSVTFEPDERVFSVEGDFPKYISYPESDSIIVNFKPRAVRYYSAKMHLHISEPCYMTDTTVLVEGVAFAPPYGLEMVYENDRPQMDTFRVINCETLEIPVYTSREFPAEVVDILCRMQYDTNKLGLIGTNSPYLTKDTCYGHIPDIKDSVVATGAEFLMKNFCTVDSTEPVLLAYFKPKNMDRDTFKIIIDSISFDTEEVILYDIIAELDSAYIIILKPEYEIQNAVDFGVIDVLFCDQRTLSVLNIGDVSLSIDSLLNLPDDVRIVSSVPPVGEYFDPGETAEIILEFCPRRKQVFDIDTLFSESINPCLLYDTTAITGEGYTPPFEFHGDIAENFYTMDEIEAELGDTVEIPIYFERDLSRDVNGTVYWLEGLQFNISFYYNKFAMKYLDYSNSINGALNLNYVDQGELLLKYSAVDSLMAGEVARLRFLIMVPDSVESSLTVEPANFDTDSIFFLDLIPLGTESLLRTIGKYNLTYLNYDIVKFELRQNVPNPWSDKTEISFVIKEESNVSLILYSMDGEEVKVILDGSKALEPGSYSYPLSSLGLESGVYYYIMKSAGQSEVRSMVLIK